MNNPFSWEYMTTAVGTEDVFDLFGTVCLVLFAVGFLVALYLYNDGGRRLTPHPLKRRLLRRAGAIATGVCGAGLFFFGIRALQFPFLTFELPIWLWLTLLTALVMVGYFVYYARRVLPGQHRAYEQHQIKQRYLRPGAARVAANPRPAPARSSRAARRRA